jgi:hypothetical protein
VRESNRARKLQRKSPGIWDVFAWMKTRLVGQVTRKTFPGGLTIGRDKALYRLLSWMF